MGELIYMFNLKLTGRFELLHETDVCFLCIFLGADTRVRVTYQEETLELTLPFGSHSRLFLSEVNRAWSGRSRPKFYI